MRGKTLGLFLCIVLFLSFAGTFAAEPVDLKSFFPEGASLDPRMSQEEYRSYDRGTLYDYINGGAEVYLDLGFRLVGARDYVVTLDDEIYFTLDVYDMVEAVNAFGIFSAERYGDVPRVDLGVDGYMGGGALTFWSTQYYVKVRADDEGDEIDKLLLKMGRHVAKTMGDPGKLPKELALFPEKHKVPFSENYAARNLMGLEFLKGFSCRYKKDKQEITLILCHFKTEKEAINGEKRFHKRLRTPPEPAKDGAGFRFNDKYLGPGRIFRAGAYLALVKEPRGKEKPAAWIPACVEAFLAKVGEASLKDKTDKALDALINQGTQEEK